MIVAPGWRSRALRRACFDPRNLAGCQLLWCGNTAAFPNAVAFPAIGGSDWDMQTVGVGAWTALRATLTKEAGGVDGGQCLQVEATAATPLASQPVLTVGNTYTIAGSARYVSGTQAPVAGDYNNSAVWQGVKTHTNWQPFSFDRVAGHANAAFGMLAGVAGDKVQFDNITITCKNVSQATDLTGLGHHLLQATAASQPLWVPSGAGGVLRFDGATDIMASGAFARNQTHQIVLGVNYGASVGGAVRYFADGNTINTAVCGRQPGTKATMCYAGSTLNGPSVANFSENCILDYTFSGASSAIGYNGAAQTVGNAGASNASGLTIGGGTGTATTYCPCDIWAIALFNAALSESDRQRVIRWMRRQGRMLGVL